MIARTLNTNTRTLISFLFLKMILSVLLSLQLSFVAATLHRKAMAKTLWHERCDKNSYALNDCNWCRCGPDQQYSCSARACTSVDMFGRFTDAIKDIDVGMEGRGYWRALETPCQPGVRYQRGALLCLCGEDGVWPNPVCRDAFQVLHPVQIPDDKQKCSPTKLYLIECNVCFCPSTGRIDPNLCTKKICNKQDPVLKLNATELTKPASFDDIYAECEANQEYKLGCRTCICLRNNRLLCGNCSKPFEKNKRGRYCDTVAPFEVFNVDCNLCYCEEKGTMVCSAKRCLAGADRSTSRRLMDIDERYFQLVQAPIDDHYCKIGTKYKKGCNICICLESESGVKMYACSLRSCDDAESTAVVSKDCVLYSKYELNCRQCSCVSANDEKWEWCEAVSRCSKLEVPPVQFDLEGVHGYCEPLHDYVKDCNKCQCLSDGKTLACSDEICPKTPKPISVDVIPMTQRGSCPNGHSYRIDCNVCVCLNNGNALCSTLNCDR